MLYYKTRYPCVWGDLTEFCGDLNETLMNFECLLRDNKSLVFADIARVIYKSFLQHFHANLYTRSIQTKEFWLENCVFCSSVQNSFKVHACKKLVSLFCLKLHIQTPTFKIYYPVSNTYGISTLQQSTF